jgi:hypothetical protein
MPVTLSIVRIPNFDQKWQFMPVTLSIVGARSVNKKMAIHAGYPIYCWKHSCICEVPLFFFFFSFYKRKMAVYAGYPIYS